MQQIMFSIMLQHNDTSVQQIMFSIMLQHNDT